MNRSWPWGVQLNMESQCRPARSTALGRCRSLAAPAVACASVPIGGLRVRRSLASSGQPDRTRSPHMTRFSRAGSKPPCRSAAATFRAGRRRRRGNRSVSDHRPDEMPALPQLLECAIKECWLSHSASPVNVSPDFSVVPFRPNFMLASEEHSMKTHKNRVSSITTGN
jgi:hypothetical protein